MSSYVRCTQRISNIQYRSLTAWRAKELDTKLIESPENSDFMFTLYSVNIQSNDNVCLNSHSLSSQEQLTTKKKTKKQ